MFEYHDKYPVNQKLQDLRENRAFLEMLLKGKKEDPRQEKPKKMIKRKTVGVIISCLFVTLYLTSMLIATNLVRRDRENLFQRNAADVIRYISTNFDESRVDSLNDIYDIGATKDGYQYISAEVHDSNNKLVGSTGKYICLTVDEETYYFEWDDYFSKPEMITLLYYARGTTGKYTVEGKIEKETNILLSLQFKKKSILGEMETVWEWENKDFAEKEEVIIYRKKGSIKDVISVPTYSIEDDEFWIHDTIKGKEYKETFSYENESGEKKEYEVVLQSAEYGWKAAASVLAPAYLAGAVVMLIGICVMIYCISRCEE